MKKLFSVRTIILTGSLLLQLSTLCLHSHGAAGDADLSFDAGSGVNGQVNAVVAQLDGKVIIGGYFTTVKGLVRTNLARLNADGSGDATFNPVIAYVVVSSLALQPDGKVLVGGQHLNQICDEFGCYELYDSLVTRLNANGSLDGSFTPATGADGTVSSVVVQPDGKVLIGGDFTSVNGADRPHVARLNANGSLDGSFFTGTGPNYGVASVALQSDGKVVIGGGFSAVNGTDHGSIARLNANGSLDSSFNPGIGYPYWVSSVVVQPDGRVLIGGYFTAVNGTNRNGIARLNANGILDSNFDPGAGIGGSWVSSVALQSDGKVLIGGPFTAVNGTNRNGIARLNANGGLDTSFNPGSGASSVSAVASYTNGQVFIGGAFTKFNGTNSNRIARLNAGGSLDASFHPGTGVDSSVPSLVVQSDGKALIGGVFTFISGTNRYGSARLNADGSVDNTFISASFNPDLAAVFNVACPPDRICENSAGVISLAVQTDGKVLVGGSYYHLEYDPVDGFIYAEYVIYRLARFNANGSLDGNFNFANTDSLGRVSSITLQSDGKIIAGSDIYPFKIARLNADGSLDSSFNPGAGPNAGVTSVALQPDGKMLVGGSFTNINGMGRGGIVRLNADGSLDGSFNTGTGPNANVTSVALQSDGKVLIGGSFTTINGTNRNRIGRLNADGSLDSTFNPGTGPGGIVRSVALQPDGNVLIGGDFLTVNGVLRPHVARLYGDSGAPSLNIAQSNAFVIVSWPASGLNFQLQESTNVSLPNSWFAVAQPAVTNVGQISVTVPTTAGREFFRLKSQ